MPPFLQQRAQRRHKGQGLVQHHMMARFGNADEGDLAIKKIMHVVLNVGVPQD